MMFIEHRINFTNPVSSDTGVRQKGKSRSWDRQTPAEVDPVKGSVFNPFAKKR